MRAILSSTVLLALSFLGLVQADETPRLVDATASDGTGYCGDASFINQSSGGSPLISDCEALRQQIRDKHLAYAFAGYGNNHWVPFDSYGSCVIGFSCQGPYGVYWCEVDSRDAADLITSSIEKFSWNGRILNQTKYRSDRSDERVQRLYAQDLSGVEGPQLEDQERIKRQDVLEGPRAVDPAYFTPTYSLDTSKKEKAGFFVADLAVLLNYYRIRN
ncbi:hypothetical protein IFM51744_08910 [Aspergillus udagawae]|nr:hypothetical protein IFM51744_08910 [Aspergillus udagawae]